MFSLFRSNPKMLNFRVDLPNLSGAVEGEIDFWEPREEYYCFWKNNVFLKTARVKLSNLLVKKQLLYSLFNSSFGY